MPLTFGEAQACAAGHQVWDRRQVTCNMKFTWHVQREAVAGAVANCWRTTSLAGNSRHTLHGHGPVPSLFLAMAPSL